MKPPRGGAVRLSRAGGRVAEAQAARRRVRGRASWSGARPGRGTLGDTAGGSHDGITHRGRRRGAMESLAARSTGGVGASAPPVRPRKRGSALCLSAAWGSGSPSREPSPQTAGRAGSRAPDVAGSAALRPRGGDAPRHAGPEAVGGRWREPTSPAARPPGRRVPGTFHSRLLCSRTRRGLLRRAAERWEPARRPRGAGSGRGRA